MNLHRGDFVCVLRTSIFLKELGISAKLIVWRHAPKLALVLRTERVYLDPLGMM